MANSRETLKKLVDSGVIVPEEYIDSAFGMGGLTDQLAEKAFLEKYGDAMLLKDVDKVENATIPTLNAILDEIPRADDDKRSKYEIFVRDFPQKAAEWKKKFTKDPVWGEKGWDTVYDTWKKVANWQMKEDIKKARKDAVNDGIYSKFASLMWPRAWEHLENTGDFTKKDMLADLAENLGMSVAGGAFTGTGAKLLGKVAPRVVNYFGGAGRNILEGAVKGAGRMTGNIAGNAVVPLTSEAMDAAIYDDTDEGMEHRADYSIGDAALGTAINQGVNRGLMRMAGPVIDRLSNNGLARGGMQKARTFLENLGKSFSEKGDDFANKVRLQNEVNRMNAGAGTVRVEDAAAMARGASPVEAMTADQAADAFRKAQVLDAIDNGDISLRPKSELDYKADVNAARKDAQIREEMRRNSSEKVKLQEQLDANLKKQADIVPDKDGVFSKKKIDQLGTLKSKENEINDAIQKNMDAEYVLKNSLKKDWRTLTPEDAFKINGMDDVNLSTNGLYSTLGKDMPEFMNYASWHGPADGISTARKILMGTNPPPPSARILNTINQAAPAWGVNKLGDSQHADLMFTPAPTLKKALKKEQAEVHQAPVKRKQAGEVLKVISANPDLTEEDRKFLKAIEEKPERVQFGLNSDNGSENTKFNLWLISRGNDLLSGTSVYRPSFRVE